MSGPDTPPNTPMMAQYHALKAQAADCLLFYRMGDFFELFFDDAKAAAQILDIALTSRGDGVPMCGVPVHAAEGYLARLIKAGQRVAIAEQIETPAEAKQRGGYKALVARDIVRFVTAGTLTEEALLEPRRANVLAAVCELRGMIGIAACDISTGRMELEECAPDQMGAALARLGSQRTGCGGRLGRRADRVRSCDQRATLPAMRGELRLKAVHGVAALDAFGEFSRAMLAAAGGLIAYLDHAGRGKLPLLLPPVARAGDAHLAMDEATRTSLEILQSSQGGRRGSLVEAVDRCVTGAGARQLAEDLSAPLTDAQAINARLALVQWLHDDPLLRGDLRTVLRALPDIGRALGPGGRWARVTARSGTVARRSDRSAAGARSSEPTRGPPRAARCAAPAPHRSRRADRSLFARAWSPHRQLSAARAALSPKAMTPRSMPCARPRAMPAARLRRSKRSTATETGIAALKIRHNGVLGYFIEVPAKHGDAADGPGLRLHPPPDDGRSGAVQRAGAARGGEPDCRGGRPCAGCRGGAFRGTGRGGSRGAAGNRRHRRSARPDRCMQQDRPSAQPRAGGACPRLSRRRAWQSKAGAIRWSKRLWLQRASALSPTIARSRPRIGCG